MRELFALAKPNGACARCMLWSHLFGYEIKLDVNGLVRSQITRDASQIQTIADEWRTAMLREGWT